MLRIIITFILIYLLFRVFTGLILPLLTRWYLNRFRKRFYRENPWHERNQQRNKNEVHISGKPPVSKKQNLGEYVDYEEIKEEDKDKDKK